MQTSSLGVLAELIGEFLVNSTYYESPSLSIELAANMISLLGSAGFLGVAAGPSVGRARFEFILPLPMDAGVELLGEVVLLIAWAVWVTPVLAGKGGHHTLLMITGCVNDGTSG